MLKSSWLTGSLQGCFCSIILRLYQGDPDQDSDVQSQEYLSAWLILSVILEQKAEQVAVYLYMWFISISTVSKFRTPVYTFRNAVS